MDLCSSWNAFSFIPHANHPPMSKSVTNAAVAMHSRQECWEIRDGAVCLDWLLGKRRYENSLIEPLIKSRRTTRSHLPACCNACRVLVSKGCQHFWSSRLTHPQLGFVLHQDKTKMFFFLLCGYEMWAGLCAYLFTQDKYKWSHNANKHPVL